MTAAHPILIFGKTGQIAQALMSLLGKKAYNVERQEADFTNPSGFKALIERVQPSAIINAVAYTQVDKAESERTLAFQVNAEAPAELARLSALYNIPFVHYSTDYVFNGEGNTGFIETDACAPLNIYGVSKHAGEKAVIAAGGNYLIFRTSWVYDAFGKNFFTTMLRLGAERVELSVVSDQIGAPSYAPHLAQATIEALVVATHMEIFPSGIYHMCNAGETSWHGFAATIFEEARKSGMHLAVEKCIPIPSSDYPTPAMRPHNSRLNCSKLKHICDVTLPDWREGMREAMHIKKTITKGDGC